MSGPGTLYVVATPLGNLADLTERARQILGSVDLVAAEDTRISRTLLARVGSRAELVSVHAHAPASRLDRVLAALAQGRSVALLCDAGTPGISDPGPALVQAARQRGIPVLAVPGPSAVVAALSVSGLPADRFCFLGFLPRSGAPRRHLLERIAQSEWTVVVFEAANRTVRLLEDLAAAAGGARPAAVARELTKLHEECRTGTLDQLAGYYREHPPRGEVTVMVAGCRPGAAPPELSAIQQQARALLAAGLSRKDAAVRLARELAISRNLAYQVVSKL